MTNLTTIISTGLNNPDCSFFTGYFLGQGNTLRILFIIVVGGLLFKFLDKIAYDPLIEYVKKKFYKKKKWH
jgi:hypothetical protein